MSDSCFSLCNYGCVYVTATIYVYSLCNYEYDFMTLSSLRV